MSTASRRRGSVVPLNCHKCGHFIGRDGYPDVFYDDYSGGYEEGYSLCGPCGRNVGRSDLRQSGRLRAERGSMNALVRRVYVASSWRNDIQPAVVAACRAAGHEAYDFKNPRPGDHGFHWSEIDHAWKTWNRETYRHALAHPVAKAGFASDWNAMEWADSCILVLPCGRSAHIEAGYFRGAGKRLVILLADGEPELMYRMADHLALTVGEAVAALSANSKLSNQERGRG